MFETTKIGTSDKKSFYNLLLKQVESVLEGETNPIANLSNASAIVFEQLNDVNWVGFYLLNKVADELVLAPFQGKVACVHIKVGKGVCGTSIATKSIQVVEDVHKFAGHIACDSNTNSEIVIPLYHNRDIVGVLDIDSEKFGRFDDIDAEWLEKITQVISNSCDLSKLIF